MTHPSSSRRYIKRVWRVPKDRGALEFFAALVVKAMVKHGWPAAYVLTSYLHDGFCLRVVGRDASGVEVILTGDLPSDFQAASEVAVRIVARMYRVDVTQSHDFVYLNRPYVVASGGHFREVKT
jgi:hypothetical protein